MSDGGKAFAWAFDAWEDHQGPGVTVPADALANLLDRLEYLEAERQVSGHSVRVIVEAGPSEIEAPEMEKTPDHH